MSDWKFYIETYGCRVNQYESEKLRSAWLARGGVETANPRQADYILINSCAITARAERDARNAVFRLKRLQPAAKVVLTGCAAQFYSSFRPRKNANWVMPDVCLPQSGKESLYSLPARKDQSPASLHSSRSRPILKIQDGCSQRCSYCIVPQTRANSGSRSRQEILQEARGYAKMGFGELVMSGINLRQYRAEGDFWDLLKWLDGRLACEYGDRLRLRISSIDPAMLDSRALDILAEAKLQTPHLHLSIQHASPAVLQAMKRGYYSSASLQLIIEAAAKIWPQMGLGADFLVGFPGESEADLIILKEFIQSLPFTYAHVFPYSRRPGTVAAFMPGQIVKAVKDERARQIRAMIAEKHGHFLQSQLRIKRMRIVCEMRGGRMYGVNDYYAQCSLLGESVRPGALISVRPVRICNDTLEVTYAQK